MGPTDFFWMLFGMGSLSFMILAGFALVIWAGGDKKKEVKE